MSRADCHECTAAFAPTCQCLAAEQAMDECRAMLRAARGARHEAQMRAVLRAADPHLVQAAASACEPPITTRIEVDGHWRSRTWDDYTRGQLIAIGRSAARLATNGHYLGQRGRELEQLSLLGGL